MTTRELPELGGNVAAGKNAYRIHFDDLHNEPWQDRLINVLLKIRTVNDA